MRLCLRNASLGFLSMSLLSLLGSLGVAGCETTIRGSGGGNTAEPLQTGVHIPAECADTAMIGAAASVYSDTSACLADQPALRERAREVGRGNCVDLCKEMSCKSTELAFPASPQAICTGRNFNTGLSYGIATTGRFICRCVIPEALDTAPES